MQELGRIEKGWGFEIVWTNNEQYCGKLLVFNKPGSKTSMIYHKDRKKSWFVNEGRFKLIYCNTKTGEYHEANLETGAAFEVNALVPHQLESLEPDSIIFEVSTPDTGEDRYRISPGDTQRLLSEQQQDPQS